MAFKSAQSSRVFVGSLNYSGYLQKVAYTMDVGVLETTTLVDTAKKFIPSTSVSTVALDVILDTDTTTGGLWDNATTWDASGVGSVFTFAPSGTATGSEARMSSMIESSFNQTSSVSGLVLASIAGTTTGIHDPGVIVEDLTQITATGNGTARDLTAASTNGGVAHLHVTAFSGVTNDVITIEQSANGSTGWTTLVTFATVTGLTSERVVVAAGVSVARYLRVVDTVTGTPTLTRSVAFARR